MQGVTRSASTQPLAATDAGERSFDFADHAKAVGIILIMVGHSPGVPALAHQLIFSFHVPLFYFLAGFLLHQRKLALGLRPFAYALLRSLLLPYALFFAVSYGYWLATCSIGPRAAKFMDVPWYEPLRGFADGLGSDLFVCPPLWFFPSLIVTSLAFHMLRKRVGGGACGLICIGAGLVNSAVSDNVPWRLPWGLDTVGIALSFYAVGHFLRESIDARRIGLERQWRVLLALLFLGLWAEGALANDAIDINERQFDGQPLLVVPTALSGIASVLLWATFVPRNGLSRWLSRHTLLIFPLHPLLFNVISGICELVLKVPASTQHSFWWPLIYTGTSLFAIAPLVWMIDAIRANRRKAVPFDRPAWIATARKPTSASPAEPLRDPDTAPSAVADGHPGTGAQT